MISKEKVETWCEYNNYLLVSLKDNKIPISKVKKIAEKAVNIYTFSSNKTRHRNIFARDLAITYLKEKHPNRRIFSEFGVNRSTFARSSKKRLLDDDTDFTKYWQKKSVEFFKDKIEKIESHL